MADMKVLRSSLASMCDDLIASAGVPFESTTELQRQLLASFAFGMTFAIGQIEHLTPPEVHALSISMLMDAFKYSAQQAGAFSSHLIECASGRSNPTIQAIIHRGIEGHRQWSSGQTAELSKNVKSVFQAIGASRLDN
jgi:Immunity protein 48